MDSSAQRDVALITGAAGGMGVACAAVLAPRADLVLTDRDSAGLERVAASLSVDVGAAPAVVACDLSRASDVDALVDSVRARGGIRWLVHTAGLSPAMADWREVLEVDLASTALLLDRFASLMRRGGAAVCFASIAGHMGTDDPVVDGALDDPLAPDLSGRLLTALGGTEPSSGISYLYAKRGVIRLCERLAAPWGECGLRIVSISPGLMDTSMGRLELIGSPEKEPLIEMTPLVRRAADGQSRLPGPADDIAQAVAFLCSDAASFVTGCDLRIDGGLIAAMR